MWRPQVGPLSDAGFRVLAPDLRGYGEREVGPEPYSHVRDVAALLDGPAAVVGASLGGRVAMELAVLHPDFVERLVLLDPGLPGWDWSEETQAGWEAESEAWERGDKNGAAEACLRLWLDRPGSRVEPLDPAVRALVKEMVLGSYELQAVAEEAGVFEAELDPHVGERLGEIACQTTVVVGEYDVSDMHGIAAHLAAEIPSARHVTIGGAAHLPSLERPDEANAPLLDALRV